jgi:hypothetical protein
MDASTRQALLQACLGAHLSHALAQVAEIGIADQIPSDGSNSVAELAAESGCHEATLYRVMRFLASHGVFVETAPGEFRHTELSKALRSDAEDSFRPAAMLFHRLLKNLPAFGRTLRTGVSALEHSVGAPLFDFLSKNPEEAAVFDRAMPAFHGPETDAMLDAYDFSGVATLADIGGGGGTLIARALQCYPTMNGILFDVGHVLGRARPNLEAAGVADRCRVVEGNFFESIPEGAEAYLMRHIIHDWGDDQSVQILSNCRKAVPENGRLLIVEAVVPEGNDPSPAKEMDITMLLYPGGMERTEAEYRRLFESSGFSLAGVTPTESMVSVIEGRPA